MPRFFKAPWPPIDRSNAGRRERGGAFTLVEILVSITVLVLLMALLLGITDQSSRVWQVTESSHNRRQVARILLETITRDLEASVFPLIPGANNTSLQFVLNPPGLTGVSARDAVFWQAALPGDGTDSDVSEVGYFVRWLDDGPASHPNHPILCRFQMPASNAASIFANPGATAAWLNNDVLTSSAPGTTVSNYQGMLADNVLALWVTLYDASAKPIPTPFNSIVAVTPRPAFAEIALVLIDPATAQRLTAPVASAITAGYGAASVDLFAAALPPAIQKGVEIFRTRVTLEAAH